MTARRWFLLASIGATAVGRGLVWAFWCLIGFTLGADAMASRLGSPIDWQSAFPRVGMLLVPLFFFGMALLIVGSMVRDRLRPVPR